MSSVSFYKEINALLHRNSYFAVQFCQNFDPVFLEILKMEILEDNCHTTIWRWLQSKYSKDWTIFRTCPIQLKFDESDFFLQLFLKDA